MHDITPNRDTFKNHISLGKLDLHDTRNAIFIVCKSFVVLREEPDWPWFNRIFYFRGFLEHFFKEFNSRIGSGDFQSISASWGKLQHPFPALKLRFFCVTLLSLYSVVVGWILNESNQNACYILFNELRPNNILFKYLFHVVFLQQCLKGLERISWLWNLVGWHEPSWFM